MPIDPTALANLLAYSRLQRPDVCEYLKVTWASGVINYYGTAAWHTLAPYTALGQTIEARIIPDKTKDPFHELELNPDLRTENISFTFDDIDKVITTRFQTYGSGVTCELFLYYPEPDPLTVSIWFGQLQAPQMYGWKTLKTVATNGFKSRELFIPSRKRLRECTANVFGGLLPDTDAVRSSLCPYDKHLGGSVGNFKTGSTPYADCPKLTKTDCTARLSNNGAYFGGFVTDATAVVTDQNGGWLAVSRGNASNLKDPIRVIFGQKVVRGNQLLLWRREHNPQTADRGFVAGIVDVSEGPVESIYNFKVRDTIVAQEHLNFRLGTRGQSRTNYATDISNFSSTAHVYFRHGWVNALEINAADLNTECQVKGFSEVCVYTDDSPVTKTRIWSDNRVWCLLEVLRNQKFGVGYKENQFTILDWMTEAAWSDQVVSHTVTFADGESETKVSRRSTFNAIVEGRAFGEQIEDIARAGGLTVPFQHDATFTIRSLRKATAGELSAARTFTDTGTGVNIIWEKEPLIKLSQTPDNKVVNEVEVRFEEASNFDNERPVTVQDRNQMLKAGRQLGGDYFLSVPKRFSAFGITALNEAVRFAYRMLWFGEFDEGGTQNNLRLTITVPFEEALGVKRYDVIKIVSDLLDPFTVGLGTNAEAPQYFRVLKLKKISNNRCEIMAQVYNHTAYTNFEVDSVSTPGGQAMYVSQAGTDFVNGRYEHQGTTGGKPHYQLGGVKLAWNTSTADWEFQYGGSVLYNSTDAVATPDLAIFLVSTGAPPAPVVDSLPPPDDDPCPLVIGSAPTYDPVTGLISIPIDPC